jgi:hypothetical protein
VGETKTVRNGGVEVEATAHPEEKVGIVLRPSLNLRERPMFRDDGFNNAPEVHSVDAFGSGGLG